ncbi:hypothetical protein [Novispirillum itersonii]|uniref:Uncharacterized protein n=1 Tax=Novispirillum itersonii TaxID=189 RepID=A0A7W9ZGD1_NOVIT|nr:hypothetical protein [Novispirillum itersonii]MBB6211016.1 hypothetical protein [Novispirillum itersonii]
MTLSNTVTKQAYSTNGGTTVWPFSFPLDRDSDLIMVLTGPGGAEETIAPGRYRVDRSSSGSPGGTVSFPLSGPALPMGHSVTLLRRVPVTQTTDLVTGAAFYAEDLERALDRQTMIDQQQQEEIGRALKIPVSDLPNGVTLPPMNTRANRVLAFDGAGGVTVSSFTLKQIESGATTELSAQDAQHAAVEADAARDVVLINKADFDPKYADFSGKYADFAPKYSLFTPAYADFAAKYADFVPKHTIAQAQWPTVQMAGKWAEEAEDVEVLPGQYSAKHWARKSAAVVLGGTTVISSNDKVPDFLGNKLLAGNGIALGVAAAGSGQTMTVSNTAVPKFYTRASAALAQNASLTLATPGVKDGEGLKRVVSVFEETVGTALTDSATDFDLADEAQFAFRAYTPNTAVTLVGNEKAGPVSVVATTVDGFNDTATVPVSADGAMALSVYYDAASTTMKAVVTQRLTPGSYTVGTPVTVASSRKYALKLLRLTTNTVVMTYRGTSSTPYVYYLRVMTVAADGTVTLGAEQVLRNSGYSYGTPNGSLCRISDTEFCAAVIDIIPGGGNQYVNFARVTVSGTVASVGSWVTLVTDTNLGGGLEVASVGSGVVAVAWSISSGAWWLRLLDVTTTPYTPGGAAYNTGVEYTDRVAGILPLSDTHFLFCTWRQDIQYLGARVLSRTGTGTPAYVSQKTLVLGSVGAPYTYCPSAFVQTAPGKFRFHGLSSGGVTNKAYYLDFSCAADLTLTVDTVQTVTFTGASIEGAYPATHILTADGFVWTMFPDTTTYALRAVEYRPSLTATLATGAWAADDAGRAVVAAGGVAKIAAISGATAELSTLSAFSTIGTFTAGNWSLRDAALYDGKVQTVKAVPAVVRTTKDSSLWEALTGLSASVSGAVKLAWSFDGRSWSVWDGSARRIIVTNRASIHGGIDPQWMVRNDADSWVFPPENNAQSALETAFGYTANQTAPAVYAALGAAGFAALGFTKSMTGTVRVGMWLPPGGSFDQLTLNYTGRSAWKRAESGYSIDYGREDQVVITRTASGTASVFATVMHVETT